MAQGYWIICTDVSDFEGYKDYVRTNLVTMTKFPSRLLVRGGTSETVEGRSRARNVVREFPDFATALACYRSPEYTRAKPLRAPYAVADFAVIDGYEGVQPPQPVEPPLAAVRKGYWIGHLDVTDPEGYKAYMAADMEPLGKFGGRFLVRGGSREVMEGKVRGRTVMIEFPSYAAALACYRSREYQAAAALRKGKAEFDLNIVEQYDGPQIP